MPRRLSALLVLALAACGDPAVGLDGTRLDGTPYFRATIGGVPWAADGIDAVDAYGRGAVQLPDGVVHLSLRGAGAMVGSQRPRQVLLQMTRATLGVPVPIDGITASMMVVTYVEPTADTSRIELVDGGVEVDGAVDTVGSVTLTAYDPIQRRLAGRFAYSAPLTSRVSTVDTTISIVSDSIVTVTDGAFLVDLGP